jgi:Putative addiction module component
MSLQQIKEQAIKLPASDRLALISALAESLQTSSEPTEDSKQRTLKERSNAIQEERRFKKYLQ